jgi:hypothetical protein
MLFVIIFDSRSDTRMAAYFPNKANFLGEKEPEPLKISAVLNDKASHSTTNSTIQMAKVSHVQSRSICFVRLVSKESDYAKLDECIGKKPVCPEEIPLQVGETCLGLFEGQWRRAEVLPGGQALFFDYGHRTLLQEKMHLEAHLKDIPPAAVLCLVPPELSELKEGDVVNVQLSHNGNKVLCLAANSVSNSNLIYSNNPLIYIYIIFRCLLFH